MTTSLVSLVSVLAGIIGANFARFIFKRCTFGLIGNTIAGVFGSVLLIKSFGRIGFDPTAITSQSGTRFDLFFINLTVSFIGGLAAVIFMSRLQKGIDKINAKKKNIK